MKLAKFLLSLLSVILSFVIIGSAAIAVATSMDMEAFSDQFNELADPAHECHITFKTTVGGRLNYESGVYQNGQHIELAATPDTDYVFSGWYGADHTLISTDPVLIFDAHHNLSIQAEFKPAPSSPSGGNGGNTGNGSTDSNTGNGSTEDQTVKNEHHFRDIYQNYNSSNATMTENMFENSLDALFGTENEETKEIISTLIGTYTESLFNQIEDMKSKEDENGTQEDLFMSTEPQAFDALYGQMTGILQDGANYRPEEEDIVDMLDAVTKSDSCMSTIEAVVETAKENTTLMDSVSSMPEEVQTVISNALSSYHQTAEEGSKSQTVCEQIADLFGITLSGGSMPDLPDLPDLPNLPDLPDDFEIPGDIELPF